MLTNDDDYNNVLDYAYKMGLCPKCRAILQLLEESVYECRECDIRVSDCGQKQ